MIEDDTIESTNQFAEPQSTRQDLAALVLRCLIAAWLIATMAWLLASYSLDLLAN
jgi:Na+/H+ antiporter NhaB